MTAVKYATTFDETSNALEEANIDNMKAYADGFSLKYEKFIHACDSEEEIVKWNVEKDGEMEAYYTNILSSIIICLMAADDEFTEKEAEFIHEIFGFTYTPEELRNIRICEMFKTDNKHKNDEKQKKKFLNYEQTMNSTENGEKWGIFKIH